MSLVLLKPFRRLSVHGEDFEVDGDDDNWVLGRRLPSLQDWPGQVEAGGERKVVLRLECLHFPLLHLQQKVKINKKDFKSFFKRLEKKEMGKVVLRLESPLSSALPLSEHFDGIVVGDAADRIRGNLGVLLAHSLFSSLCTAHSGRQTP